MDVKYSIVFQLLLVVVLTYNVDAKRYDITKYGARGDGVSDSSLAITNAWNAACASPVPSLILIPRGTYMTRNVKLMGPCKAPIRINLQGTLRAPAFEMGQEWILIYHVNNFTLQGAGTIDGNGQNVWQKKLAKQIKFGLPTSLVLSEVTGGLVEGITSLNSKMFHINVFHCNDITFQGVTIIAPYESPNTDGIHIGRSTNVKVLYSDIRTGDDCVSIGDGSQQVRVQHVNCGPGHGIAVGSLGLYPDEENVSGVYIQSCSLTNTENGLRIKTWEDSKSSITATDIHFEDITLTNVTYPINIDQEYCPSGNCPKVQTPSKVKIDNLSFKGIRGTSATSQIVKMICSKSNPCSNVEIGDINIKFNGLPGPDSSICSNVQPKLTGIQFPTVCTSKPQAF